MKQKEYISELESLVCIFANAYVMCKHTYRDKHLETCSIGNPNRRELTEDELNQIMNFPLLQGTYNNILIEKLVENGPKNSVNHFKEIVDKIINKV